MTVPLELRPDTPGSDIDGMQFEFAPDLSLGRRLAFAYEHLSSSLYEGDPEAVIMSRLADMAQAWRDWPAVWNVAREQGDRLISGF